VTFLCKLKAVSVCWLQVYDELLAAALKAEGCGPRNLELFGPWKWLLQEFAAVYGVRHHYTSLSYLKWVVRPENASVTALCFDVLLRELVPLKQVTPASAHAACFAT
jgi:hypothetical protein